MKIVGYVRVSTDQQVESGLGIDAQIKALNEFAKRQGEESITILRDEGMSGSLPLEKRQGILNAIALLKKGDTLLVAKRDRIGRDPMIVAMIESAVKRKGARIVSVAGEGTDNDDPSSILMRRMVDAFGEYERLIIGARTKAALRAKKERGERIGHIPFGKKLSNTGSLLLDNIYEQKIMKRIKTLRGKGFSIRKIASLLNEKKLFNRGNNRWNHASIHRIVSRMRSKE